MITQLFKGQPANDIQAGQQQMTGFGDTGMPIESSNAMAANAVKEAEGIRMMVKYSY